MAEENNFMKGTDFPTSDSIFNIEALEQDIGLDLPQSLNIIGVESNNSWSITKPINQTPTSSHAKEYHEGLGVDRPSLNLNRKHKMSSEELCSPPKIAKRTHLSKKVIESCPDEVNDITSNLFKNSPDAYLEPWAANVIEPPPHSDRSDIFEFNHTIVYQNATQDLHENSTNAKFYQDSNYNTDLNHTVTSETIQRVEPHITLPTLDVIELSFADITHKKQTSMSNTALPKNKLLVPTAGTSTTVTSAYNTIQPKIDPPVITISDDEEDSSGPKIEPQPNNNKKKYDELIFQQLIDIFPEADKDFIKEQCCLHSQINVIIGVILEMNNMYPKRKTNINPGPREESLSADKDSQNVASVSTSLIEPTHQSQLDFLLQIFPDADPTFLEAKSKLNDKDLTQFVSEATETKNYPKVEKPATSEKKEEPEDNLGLYTSSFDIKQFLKVFKDPFTYYLDANRECKRNQHSFEFMKKRFKDHSSVIIMKTYKKFKYNLSKTCEVLELEPASRITKRQKHEIKMPVEVNLPFLQEACFVEHKQEIKEYLDKILSDRQTAYTKAEERGELIECGCCYQELLFEECAACNEGDLFCKTCIQKSAEVRIGDGLTTFPCLINCPSSFSMNLLENLLEPQVFSRLLKRIQLDEVKAAEIEGLEVCPFCEFATIPPPDTKIFTCLNPDCLKESCRQCHKVSHIPKRCEEIENDDQEKARKYIEDEMTRALVRECYKCKRSFIKTDGCNKMTCTCGAKMCYICRQPVTDYKHFNGPGGEQTNLCPLYSTDQLLHVDAVADVAKKALEKVKAENPDLKLLYDPSTVLPTASQAGNNLPPGVQEAPAQLVQRLNNVLFPARPGHIHPDVEIQGLHPLIIQPLPPPIPQPPENGQRLRRPVPQPPINVQRPQLYPLERRNHPNGVGANTQNQRGRPRTLNPQRKFAKEQ